MDFLKEHWYLALGALVIVFLLAKRGGGGITQVSGGTDVAQLAAISSAERDADENRKYGLASSILNYDLSVRSLASQDSLARIGLGQQLDLAHIYADSQVRAAASQYQLAQLASNTQLSQYSQQAALQQYALQTAANTQRRNDWLGAISTGLQTILPVLFGNTSSSGGNSGGGIFGNGGLLGSGTTVVWH